MGAAEFEAITERVERELERARAARPHLAERVSRAENILVTHLSCKRHRLIRIRISGGPGSLSGRCERLL